MNLIELLFFIIFLSLSVFLGKFLGTYLGILGWIFGFIIGILSGITTSFFLNRFVDIWYKWCPLRPKCKNGNCSSDDYQIIESRKDGAVFLCQCGTKYFQNWPKRDRFMEVLDDGSIVPYMKRRGIFGRWEKEM